MPTIINPSDQTINQYAVQSGGANNLLNNINAVAIGQVLVSSGVSAQPAFSANPTVTSITFGGGTPLNSYVQGTWTPGISFGGGTTGITYVDAEGQYTRIGNILYFSCLIKLSSIGSSTGAAAITGFPFTPNFALAQNTSHISSLSNFTLGAGYDNVFLDTSGVVTTTIPMVKTGASVGYLPMTEAEFANNSRLEFNAFYFL